MGSHLEKIKEKIIQFWFWFTGLFINRYKLTVSYNAIYGDSDDETFIVRKFYTKQEKYLKFKTDDKEIVEIRGAEGLNYRIQEL